VSATAVDTAREYYNSEDADSFYSEVWGGEDIHIGVYRADDEPIKEASRRTVVEMAKRLPRLDGDTHLLDIGSGYCGAARYLAGEHGIRVTAVNLSEVENQRARELNEAAGLGDKIEVIDGSFEELPFDSNAFDAVWSQDAILHSERRKEVLGEVLRVLKPGGVFVFTDPMQADNCPEGVLQPILDRIHLSSLGSPGFYEKAAKELGFASVSFEELTQQLVNHYTRVLEETKARAADLEGKVSGGYIERMQAGLQHWIDGGRAGNLAWGIFELRKP
jgi:sarcosine/dimethylglycine N-methyltransferase